MLSIQKLWLAISLIAGMYALGCPHACIAQVPRYQPTRPTVSPYLMLFRDQNNNANGGRFNQVLPNYQAFVRPLQQQYETNQYQQNLIQQQSQQIQQLQSSVQTLQIQQQQQLKSGQLVAPTGKGGWFNRQSTTGSFQNTSTYYQNSGSGGRR